MRSQLSAANRWCLVSLLLLVVLPASVAWPAEQAKNVILMVCDGASFNAWQAASYYRHGRLGGHPFDRFPKKYGCTTYMLNYVDEQDRAIYADIGKTPRNAVDTRPQAYDPRQMWQDFNYAKGRNNYLAITDSAAAATALYTGHKTTRGRMAMNWSGKQPLTTIAQIADSLGKSTGTISSVQVSHATPGAVWAHNPSRGNYSAIFQEMLYQGGLDDGPLPQRVVGIAQVRDTLQQKRGGRRMDPDDPKNEHVPNLPTMTKAALNVLNQNPQGFFLLVEGGAVDWANHQNDFGRMIEEVIEFNDAARAVIDWVRSNSSWNQTLLIITADHECGMLWGESTFIDKNDNGRFDDGVDIFQNWQPIQNRGKGSLPGHQYGSGGHTNTLVPLWAKGAGCRRFAEVVDGTDTTAGEKWGFSGQYVDNTSVFAVMQAAMDSDTSSSLSE